MEYALRATRQLETYIAIMWAYVYVSQERVSCNIVGAGSTSLQWSASGNQKEASKDNGVSLDLSYQRTWFQYGFVREQKSAGKSTGSWDGHHLKSGFVESGPMTQRRLSSVFQCPRTTSLSPPTHSTLPSVASYIHVCPQHHQLMYGHQLTAR